MRSSLDYGDMVSLTRRIALALLALTPFRRARAEGRRRTEGAALRDPRRRNGLRPGADLRPVFAHHRRGDLRCAAAVGIPRRPVRYRPNTLVALPEVSADFTTFTFRVKPGIFFADDAAFKGTRRELVAADYVYAWKRHYDPR